MASNSKSDVLLIDKKSSTNHLSLEELECYSTDVANSVKDTLFRGIMITGEFDSRKQSLSIIINEQYDYLIKIVKERKQFLLSQIADQTLFSIISSQLTIERCQQHLTSIKSYCELIDIIKNGKFGDTNSRFVHKMLKGINSSLIDIQFSILNMFKFDTLQVALHFELFDCMIKYDGDVVQLSFHYSTCSATFFGDCYKILLIPRSTKNKIYQYGNLSMTAYFSQKVSKDAVIITDNKDSSYTIKLPYDPKFKDSSITVEVNGKILAELTELYALVDQVDILNIVLPHVNIIDGGDELYIRTNLSDPGCMFKSTYNLIRVDRDKIYILYPRIYSDIWNSLHSTGYFHHDRMTVIGTSKDLTKCIYLYHLNGELIKQYTSESCSDIKEVSQAIYMQFDSEEYIVFINDSPDDGKISVDDCKIGVLNCKDGKIKTKISSDTIGSVDVKIVLGDEYIYAIGKYKYQPNIVIVVFDKLGNIISTKDFTEDICNLSIGDDIIAFTTKDHSIVLYDKDLSTIKCKIKSRYKYDIIRFDKDRVYAISTSSRILSTWNFPKCLRRIAK